LETTNQRWIESFISKQR